MEGGTYLSLWFEGALARVNPVEVLTLVHGKRLCPEYIRRGKLIHLSTKVPVECPNDDYCLTLQSLEPNCKVGQVLDAMKDSPIDRVSDVENVCGFTHPLPVIEALLVHVRKNHWLQRMRRTDDVVDDDDAGKHQKSTIILWEATLA